MTPWKRYRIALNGLRKHLGLTQEELGRLAGKSKSAVSQWERGDTQPERDSLLALQQAKKVNPLWVAEGKEPMILNSLPTTEPQPIAPGPTGAAAASIGALMSRASPRSRTILDRIAQAADAGRLTDADIELLDQIAERFARQE